jgi:hypothetical protein
MVEIPQPEPPPVAAIIRRATLYGAGLGVIAGLIDRAVLGDSAGEVAAIERWRNFILVGAAVGLLLGAAFAWITWRGYRLQVAGFRKESERTNATSPPAT